MCTYSNQRLPLSRLSLKIVSLLVFFLCTLFVLTPFHKLHAASKKTVCSMTMNSTEEIELFKKNLGSQNWNFIELTQFAKNNDDQNWLKNACSQNISCDVVVISGHFGGTFFGNSPFKLSTDTLETLSCENQCQGLLSNPKEVFLFGCNTLASKNQDNRTPEEYMQVLLNDGFSYEQASQIVSFRYSDFGDSFKAKMSSIFGRTPLIYGFNAKGPSGKTIEPLLQKYFDRANSNYSNFDNYIAQQSTQPNQALAQALKNTKFEQASGTYPKIKNVEEKPYCYIKSEKINHLAKLKYIDQLFTQKSALKILSHIQIYLSEIHQNENQLTQAEKRILQKIQTNKDIKKDLQSVLALNGDVYIPLKAKVITALLDLRMISESEAQNYKNSLIDVTTSFTEARQNYLCSAGIKTKIPLEKIPTERFKETYFISTLSCLDSLSKDFLTYLNKNIFSSEPLLKANSIWSIHFIKPNDREIFLNISKTLQNEPQDFVRFAALSALIDFKTKDPEIFKNVLMAFATEKNDFLISKFNQFVAQYYK